MNNPIILLDDIDRRILNALQIDASQTNSELARLASGIIVQNVPGLPTQCFLLVDNNVDKRQDKPG